MENLKRHLEKLEEINRVVKILEERKYFDSINLCYLDLGWGDPTDRAEYVNITSLKRDLLLESLKELREKLKADLKNGYNLNIDDEGKIHP